MGIETRAVIVVASLLRQADNSNPDDGTGWGDDYFIDRAAELLKLTERDFNRSSAQAALKGK